MAEKRWEIVAGDCLETLKTLANCSVDSIVTDPPYGLKFMGKAWDHSVPSVDVWRECLRVLKPGGHLLAFAGTRTQHRMACAIEDAGFEIRDMIAWVYGSGFPKSLDVSRAIDKQRDDSEDIHRVVRWIEARRVESGVTRAQVEAHFGTQNIGQALFTITEGSKSRVATWEQWIELKSLLKFDNEMDAEVWRLNGRKGKPGEAFAEREVVGRSQNGIAGGSGRHAGQENAYGFSGEYDITAPATPEAQQWAGWGTALKPALEPITVARKPLCGTVADNVLEWGTGALNVDGCRIKSDELNPSIARREAASKSGKARTDMHSANRLKRGLPAFNKDLSGYINGNPGEQLGRWPANIIHDGSDEVEALFPEAGRGSASRFFYCAKASRSERDMGCEELPEIKRTDGRRTEIHVPNLRTTPRSNHHPTVKPTDLMRYLVRLVTPPGGLVLDPFAGTGSTGRGAVLEGFCFLGCEIDANYAEIARLRIGAVAKKVRQPELFS